MRRQHSLPPDICVDHRVHAPEHGRSAHIRVPFLKSRGLLSLFVAAVIVVGLVDRFTGNAPAEPHAQVWVGRAAESGAIDTVIHAYDGKTLASLDSNGHIALWNVGTGRWHEFQPEATGWVRSLAFSPDGQTLAGGVLDSTIVLWDMDTLRARTELRAHVSPVSALAYSPDGGMMASASIDGVITLWRTTSSYSSIRQFRASTGITALVFSPDGAMLATSHSNGLVTIWDIVSPGRSTKIGSDLGYSRTMAFSPDGQTLVLAAVTSSQIQLWDLRAGGCARACPDSPVAFPVSRSRRTAGS